MRFSSQDTSRSIITNTIWLWMAHVQNNAVLSWSWGNIRMSTGHCLLHSHGRKKWKRRTGVSAYLEAVSKAVKGSGPDKSLIQCSEAVNQPMSTDSLTQCLFHSFSHPPWETRAHCPADWPHLTDTILSPAVQLMAQNDADLDNVARGLDPRAAIC